MSFNQIPSSSSGNDVVKIEPRDLECPPSYEDSVKYCLQGYPVRPPFRALGADVRQVREVTVIAGEIRFSGLEAFYLDFKFLI